MRTVKVGLIGYGLSGAVFHAPLIASVEGFALTKVVSSKIAKVQADLPQAEVVADVESLLADQEIELIVVTSPNPTHYQYTKMALEANKHVIVEKPFANSSKEADELIALAAEKKLLLSVFQNRRWDNDFLTVRKCIEEGLLGDIYSYEAHFDMYRPIVSSKWKEHAGEGSGALYDLGPHLFDQAVQLFGMPKTIWADAVKQRPGAEVDDYFHVVMGYDKLRVVLQSSCFVKQAGPRYEVHGSKGSLIKYGQDPQQADLQAGMRPGHSLWGQDKPEWYAQLTLGRDVTVTSRVKTIPGCYEVYYQGMYQAIASGAPLPVRAEEARDNIRLIEYAWQSVREQRVITLP